MEASKELLELWGATLLEATADTFTIVASTASGGTALAVIAAAAAAAETLAMDAVSAIPMPQHNRAGTEGNPDGHCPAKGTCPGLLVART